MSQMPSHALAMGLHRGRDVDALHHPPPSATGAYWMFSTLLAGCMAVALTALGKTALA